jgi:hypothetical protein
VKLRLSREVLDCSATRGFVLFARWSHKQDGDEDSQISRVSKKSLVRNLRVLLTRRGVAANEACDMGNFNFPDVIRGASKARTVTHRAFLHSHLNQVANITASLHHCQQTLDSGKQGGGCVTDGGAK